LESCDSTMKVVHSALEISLSPWERVGVRGSVMTPATVVSGLAQGP